MKYEITIIFEDGEIQKRKYSDYDRAVKACGEYDNLKAAGTHSIKSVHIKEVQ